MKSVDEINKCLDEIETLSLRFAVLSANDQAKRGEFLDAMKRLFEQLRSVADEKHTLFESFLKKQGVVEYWLNWINRGCGELKCSPLKPFPLYRLVYSAADEKSYESLADHVAAVMKVRALERHPVNFDCTYEPKKYTLTFSGNILSAQKFLDELGYTRETDKGCIKRVRIELPPIAPKISSPTEERPSLNQIKLSL